MDDPILDLFVPWMLFNFPMELWDKAFDLGIDVESSLAEYCLNQNKITFTPEEKRILKDSLNRPYSFFEICKKNSTTDLELQDLMLGKKQNVMVPAGREWNVGEILITSISSAKEQSFSLGIGPVSLPPEFASKVSRFKSQILEEESRKKFTAKLLSEVEPELMNFYFGNFQRSS